MRTLLVALASLGLTSLAVSCGPSEATSQQAVRAAIERQLSRGVAATRTKDIAAYMEQLPVGSVIHDEAGHVITRDEQRANVLRDWSIIDRTLEIWVKVDSLATIGDSATVYTSQYWKRLMFERDGRTLDTVATTQRHREIWRRSVSGWLGYEVQELGGTVLVNGRPYP
jgi:hypothetical protein